MPKSKEHCINCKHYLPRDCNLNFCGVTLGLIKHPRTMGGSEKCECYSRAEKVKYSFEYPKKEELK